MLVAAVGRPGTGLLVAAVVVWADGGSGGGAGLGFADDGRAGVRVSHSGRGGMLSWTMVQGRPPPCVCVGRTGPPAVSGSRVGVSRAAVAGSTLRDLLRVGEALAGADAVRPVVVGPQVDLC